MWNDWREFRRRPWAVFTLILIIIVMLASGAVLALAESAAAALFTILVPLFLIWIFRITLFGRRDRH